ncbi:MAG: hypothetical protein WAM11_09340 [Cyanobium sp.]
MLGAVAGRAERRQPREVRRSIHGLTTGSCAVLVTFGFVHSRLDWLPALERQDGRRL